MINLKVAVSQLAYSHTREFELGVQTPEDGRIICNFKAAAFLLTSAAQLKLNSLTDD